jgi:hypothetical protein
MVLQYVDSRFFYVDDSVRQYKLITHIWELRCRATPQVNLHVHVFLNMFQWFHISLYASMATQEHEL